MKSFFTSRFFAASAFALALAVGVFVDFNAGLASYLAANALALAVLPAVFGVINTTAVSNTIQPHYSKKLLERAIQMVTLQEFGAKEAIEAGSGAVAVRFFRPPQADLTATGAPAALSEGVAPTDFRDIAYTAIDVTLAQRGQVSKVTDIANTVGLVKYLDTAIELQGDEFALDIDTIIRNQITDETNGFTKRYAQGAATFAALASATLANGAVIPRDFLDAMTRLKINRAPKINGHYVAIVPPQGTRDILNNSEFREVVRQNYPDKIFKGEIGDYYGLRIVEGTNPFIEDETEGTFDDTFDAGGSNTTGLIYSTAITGKGAYGTVDMKKLGGVAKKPTLVIVDKPDSGNPLAQYVIVGWKAFWASVVLNSAWGVTLRHKTLFA